MEAVVNPALRALADTSVLLGEPALVRLVGEASAPAAAVARWQHGEAVVDIVPSGTVRLTLSLRDGPHARTPRGARCLADRVRSGSLSIFSPVEPSRVVIGGPADVLQIFLPCDFAEASAGQRLDYRPLYDLHDASLQAAFLQILVGTSRGNPDDPLMAEESLHRLVHRLQKLISRQHDEPDRMQGGLSPAALRRLEDIIQSTLEGTPPAALALSGMAEAASLSVSHFVRAFRRQHGITPYQYLLRRRIERAVMLLRVPGVSVAEVADSVGFSTPAHFVATFRAVMGVTPGAAREALTR